MTPFRPLPSGTSGSFPLLAAALFLVAGLSSSCGSSGASGANKAASTGDFKVENASVSSGDVWALNRPILVSFNHPVDPTTIGFSTILIRGVSPAVQGRPVTGTFSILAGSDGKTILFQPACPTNEANDNGAFVPGGNTYEIILPTIGAFGDSVLRDKSGHPLTVGLARQFFTPTPPVEPLFIDTVQGPPLLTSVEFPAGLNLYTRPDPSFILHFNQSIQGASSNLGLDRVRLLYSAGEIGSGNENTFPSANLLPGKLFLSQNCLPEGATLVFQAIGILPSNRNIMVEILPGFRDIAGQDTITSQSRVQTVISLTTFYGFDPTFNEEDKTIDSFPESFDSTADIDLSASLPFPPAEFGQGQVTASFGFPGDFQETDADFVLLGNKLLEIDTTPQSVLITDSNGRDFEVKAGVLQVDDFTIGPEATLRGRGANPLVIYANGTVDVQGTIDVSGNNALPPIALNAPHIPEPGALGECGGGDGGTSSSAVDLNGKSIETVRGEDGFGPFGSGQGTSHGGGQGGEGGFQQSNLILASDPAASIAFMLVGGGGGGTFGRGRGGGEFPTSGGFPVFTSAEARTNALEAILWNAWSGDAVPEDFDDSGPDHDAGKHPTFNVSNSSKGGEDGRRGSSARPAGDADPVHGMEDLVFDDLPNDAVFDPVNFVFGHPTNGPDIGRGGDSPFQLGDLDGTRNDFWGLRFNPDPAKQAFTVGELMAPMAGAGGGASGDCQVVTRQDLDADGNLDPLGNFFPDPQFPVGTTFAYFKGAPGGGGGGQLLLVAIGPIILGNNARLLANGGIGNAGESIFQNTDHVSGSGGGSGGHIVVESATGLDLSQLNLGSLATQNDVLALIKDFPNHPNNLQALGGRRGWSASLLVDPANPDGNRDNMVGRGGAGGNGVIQVHVPDPENDIAWPAAAAPGIMEYIHDDGNGAFDLDRLEEVMDVVGAPVPFLLVPFFGSASQFQTKWKDTGLAGLRNPDNGAGPYPDYADPLLQFAGIETSDPGTLGNVLTSGGMVIPLSVVATGPVAAVSFSAFQVVIPSASSFFGPEFLRNPQLLCGFDVFPDNTTGVGFEVTAATYNRASNQLTLSTLVPDGPMTVQVNPANPWAVRQKFFRASTTGVKDRLPDTASIKFQFQGASESATTPNTPDLGSIVPGTNQWTSDLSLLKGLRFIRVRVTFEIDALGNGVTLSSEKPALSYMKLPFVW